MDATPHSFACGVRRETRDQRSGRGGRAPRAPRAEAGGECGAMRIATGAKARLSILSIYLSIGLTV